MDDCSCELFGNSERFKLNGLILCKKEEFYFLMYDVQNVVEGKTNAKIN